MDNSPFLTFKLGAAYGEAPTRMADSRLSLHLREVCVPEGLAAIHTAHDRWSHAARRTKVSKAQKVMFAKLGPFPDSGRSCNVRRKSGIAHFRVKPSSLRGEEINTMSSIDELLMQRGVFGKFVSEEVLKIILENRSLRWSRPSSFNDPFDFQVNFGIKLEVSLSAQAVLYFEKVLLEGPMKATGRDTVSTFINSLVRDFYDGKRGLDDTINLFQRFVDISLPRIQNTVIDEGSSALNDIMANSLIFCTTLEIQSLLMWSHYSDGHKGAFLLFQPKKNNNWGERFPINYDDDFPRIWRQEGILNELAGHSSESLIGHPEDVSTAILTKSSQWGYEKEERFIVSDNEAGHVSDRPFDEDELSAVVFGCKFPTDNSVDLRNQYSPTFSRAEFFSSSKLDDQYGLRFEALK